MFSPEPGEEDAPRWQGRAHIAAGYAEEGSPVMREGGGGGGEVGRDEEMEGKELEKIELDFEHLTK